MRPPAPVFRSAGKAALVPANITHFAEGLDVPESDVRLYLALREAAHQRLFAGVPWLRDHLIGAALTDAGPDAFDGWRCCENFTAENTENAERPISARVYSPSRRGPLR